MTIVTNSERVATFQCNGRTYRKPQKPTIVVCIDGSEPGYIEAAIAAGRAPNFERFIKNGANLTVHSVVPSFTNPNNMSIITGRPPAVHGIAGNYFFDPATGEEVMMNDAKFLRAPTIMKEFHDAGGRVAVITAKDKLRGLLCKDIDFSSGRAVGFSSEKADQVTAQYNGIENVVELVGMAVPDVYSSELSEFVLAAGVKLLATRSPELMYLSTTDYIQHKAAPGSQIANDFYAMMDRYVGDLDAAGANLVLTADHGMNDKVQPDKTPKVVYLQELFDQWLRKDVDAGGARVILPITDPYVVHHGALGSFATVYLPPDTELEDMTKRLLDIDGIDIAIGQSEACERFELPPDRIGDLVVISGKHTVLGTSEARHDLSGLGEPLRSHGGTTEQVVPLISNRPISVQDSQPIRNFDAFDVALNQIS
ncbi:MAG: phosphonoacetate hydrolase [Hyphomicrobiaceae bacterium]